MRNFLSSEEMTPEASKAVESFHSKVVQEVAATTKSQEWVVVGMGWNPLVGKAKRLLEARGKSFKYLGYGNYLSGWKIRLAIKIWSGWPTFPQVFHKGKLVGGFTDLERFKD